jgi:riboflavin synthase
VFTGIVEAVGTVRSLEPGHLILENPGLEGLVVGESISVSGVCLTAIEPLTALHFDLSEETLSRSNLGDLQPGHLVNLERAMQADGRFGGHFVQGHVDCLGTIVSMPLGVLRVKVPEQYDRYLVDKGSVAIDGISLTVIRPEGGTFEAAIIPHTMEHTNLKSRRAGNRVNIEFDVLAKHVEKLLAR